MVISRRSLRKILVVVGCLIGTPGFATAAAGGALITFGCILHLWSKGCLEQNRRLITAGPYRFSRNPFYLANLFIDLGTCFVIGQIWVGIIYLVLWALAYRDTIEGEEAKLAALFPGQFERYVSFVPRLFPNGGVFPAADVTGHFSFENDGLARGQEYARIVGIGLGPAAIGAAALLRSEGLGLFDLDASTALACILALPACWVLKLGLSEMFRRPGNQLLPVGSSSVGAVTASIGLAGLAAYLFMLVPWWSVVPGLWSAIAGLEAWRGIRAERRGISGTGQWSYLPTIALGSVVLGAGMFVIPVLAS